MQQSVFPPAPTARTSARRARRLVALSVCAVAATVPTALTVGSLSESLVSFAVAAPPAAGDSTIAGATADSTVGADDGVIPEGVVVTLADDVPAIARLDAALREAMRRAEQDAAADGIPSFPVTSGWRSEAYQRWLLLDAVERYGSEETARQFVATPERSKHVTGDAVDIGAAEAQSWLIAHGAAYGLCQTYANERWHFELATEPGGECPAMKADAAS